MNGPLLTFPVSNWFLVIDQRPLVIPFHNPQMVSLSLLTVVPEWANRGNLHGSLPWALRAVEGVEAEIKGTWIIPHWQPPLSSWFGIGGEGENCRVECGGGWRSGEATPPTPTPAFPPPPNLYPPLTPVPQCVAEIRAIGQSPFTATQNILKLSPLA